MKRTALRRRSAKASKRQADRRACIDTVFLRDNFRCQFPVFVAKYVNLTGEAAPIAEKDRKCYGTLCAHEPAHRRNVDILDPANSVTSCSFHNGWAEDHPALAYEIGWLVRGNGAPLRL